MTSNFLANLQQTFRATNVSVLPGLEAHASGALWIPETQTAIVADVHLGYSWAQRRRGELGPLADSRTHAKLLQLCDSLEPRKVIFLGDLVHAPRPCPEERDWIEQVLTELSRRAELIAVRGNHDRAFPKEFGHLPLETVEDWSTDRLLAVHGDRFTFAWPEGRILIIGHLHPSFPVLDAAGAGAKLPVFLASSSCVVVPAFSPFARGYTVTDGLPAEIEGCFQGQEINAYVVSGTRVVHLGSLAEARRRIFDLKVSAPASFRRRRGRVL